MSPTLIFDHPTSRELPRAFGGLVGTEVRKRRSGRYVRLTLPSASLGSGLPSGPRLEVGVRAFTARWPGGVSNQLSLQTNLRASGDGVTAVPTQRWSLSDWVDRSQLTDVQLGCVQHGGFVANTELFDQKFFGVPPAEAAAMDPQQRMLLEIGYEALHMAGLSTLDVRGTNTAVVVG